MLNLDFFVVIGKAFKKEAKSVTDQLANLSLEDITKYEAELGSNGEFQLNDSMKITKDMVQVKRQTKQVGINVLPHPKNFIPNKLLQRYSMIESRN